MKKITLLILLLTTTIGLSQEMPIDFEDSNDVFAPFNGAATSIIDDGGDMVMQMVGAANAWDGATITFANLVDLSDDSNNTITFWINVPSGSSNTHLLKFEENVIGTGPADAQLDFITSGTGWQQIQVDFGAGLGSYGKMSIFPDRGDANASVAVTYLFDDFSGATTIDRPANATPPTTAAPTPPARDAADVISLYSDAYTDVQSNFDAGWCGAGSVEEVMIAGNNTQFYKSNACQGIVLDSGIDATTFNKLHVDVYISPDVTDFTGKVFNLKFVNQPGGAAVEYNFNSGSTPPLQAGSWISIDVDVDLSAMSSFKEFGITCNFNGTLWYDNLYVYKDSGSGGGGGSGDPTTDAGTPSFNNMSDYSAVFSSLGDAIGLVPSAFANATQETVQINGNDTKKFSITNPGGGAQFAFAPIDLSTDGYTHIYFDWYFVGTTGAGRQINLNVQGTGANIIGIIPIASASDADQWKSFNMALANLTNGTDPTNAINQIQFTGAGGADPFGTIYIDNVVFYKAGTLSSDNFAAIESSVFPNPSSDQWNIRTPNNIIESVDVYNVLGRRVLTRKNNSGEISIPVSSLSSGIYITKINTDSGTKTVKLIRE